MPRSKEEICVQSTRDILAASPAISEIQNQIATIAVDEVLTLDVQKDKISGNALVLIAAAQNQIAETIHMADPVQAAQVAEKMMSVYQSAQGTNQIPQGFGIPSFAGAKTAFLIAGMTR